MAWSSNNNSFQSLMGKALITGVLKWQPYVFLRYLRFDRNFFLRNLQHEREKLKHYIKKEIKALFFIQQGVLEKIF